VSPEEKRVHLQAVLQSAFRMSHFSGPLPPPEALAGYEKILPGAADRIFKMAEDQNAHRRHLETTAIESKVSVQKWGLIGGLVVAMTAIGGGIYLTAHGMSGSGLAAIITPLAALVGVFIYGKTEQKKELKEKAEALTMNSPNEIPEHPASDPATHS